MSRKFPSDELLADYASGALPAGLSLLVASHLTFSPDSRRRVADFEGLGGALLGADAAEGLDGPDLSAALARLDDPDAWDDAPRDDAPILARGPVLLPAPLRRVLGADADDLPWKFRLPGLSEVEIDGFEGEEVSLLRARPGAPLFSHTHEGVESTLVLTGLLEDRGAVFGRGDVAIATAEDDHRPRIIGEETCICLIVMSGGLRFTGPFSRALNLFAE